jgi:hypothetical protein
MTPATTGAKGRGNFEIDRTIAGVHIRRSSGTRDLKKFRRLIVILEKAGENSEVELLRAFARGDVTPDELIEADRHDRRSRLSSANIKLRVPLWDRLVDGKEVPGAVSKAFQRIKGPKTLERYLSSWTILQRLAQQHSDVAGLAELGRVDAPVSALDGVAWEEFAAVWPSGNDNWMHLRRAISRFLSLHLGDKWDPFARQLRQAIPLKRPNKRRPRLSIDQFVRIAQRMPAHAAAGVWFLVITGVRLEEWQQTKPVHLDDATHSYLVPGADKNEVGAFPLYIDPRLWSYVKAAVPARLRPQQMRKHWKRACAGEGVTAGRKGITLHDLRHCHGQWAVNAGVAESKVQASLRHENPAQTRDYVMQRATLDVSNALADALLPAKPTRKQA